MSECVLREGTASKRPGHAKSREVQLRVLASSSIPAHSLFFFRNVPVDFDFEEEKACKRLVVDVLLDPFRKYMIDAVPIL